MSVLCYLSMYTISSFPQDLESLQETRPDVVMSEPSILSPIVEGLQKVCVCYTTNN